MTSNPELGERVRTGTFETNVHDAGRGAPVSGLSGAPVWIDGAVVGLLRWATLDEQGQVMSANPAVATIFGWPESDLVGRDIRVLLAPDASTDLLALAGARGAEPRAGRAAPLDLQARMFHPGSAGLSEDPATGSATERSASAIATDVWL